MIRRTSRYEGAPSGVKVGSKQYLGGFCMAASLRGALLEEAMQVSLK